MHLGNAIEKSVSGNKHIYSKYTQNRPSSQWKRHPSQWIMMTPMGNIFPSNLMVQCSFQHCSFFSSSFLKMPPLKVYPLLATSLSLLHHQVSCQSWLYTLPLLLLPLILPPTTTLWSPHQDSCRGCYSVTNDFQDDKSNRHPSYLTQMVTPFFLKASPGFFGTSLLCPCPRCPTAFPRSPSPVSPPTLHP